MGQASRLLATSRSRLLLSPLSHSDGPQHLQIMRYRVPDHLLINPIILVAIDVAGRRDADPIHSRMTGLPFRR